VGLFSNDGKKCIRDVSVYHFSIFNQGTCSSNF
jgi:hypothetical protein